jgi:hypothetical protein
MASRVYTSIDSLFLSQYHTRVLAANASLQKMPLPLLFLVSPRTSTNDSRTIRMTC